MDGWVLAKGFEAWGRMGDGDDGREERERLTPTIRLI